MPQTNFKSTLKKLTDADNVQFAISSTLNATFPLSLILSIEHKGVKKIKIKPVVEYKKKIKKNV